MSRTTTSKCRTCASPSWHDDMPHSGPDSLPCCRRHQHRADELASRGAAVFVPPIETVHAPRPAFVFVSAAYAWPAACAVHTPLSVSAQMQRQAALGLVCSAACAAARPRRGHSRSGARRRHVLRELAGASYPARVSAAHAAHASRARHLAVRADAGAQHARVRRRWQAYSLFAQGVLDVLVNTRMTVLKLRDGSLFVYAPVAPTRECLRLVRELEAPVRYIVLPTSAVEHKVGRCAAQRACTPAPVTNH